MPSSRLSSGHGRPRRTAVAVLGATVAASLVGVAGGAAASGAASCTADVASLTGAPDVPVTTCTGISPNGNGAWIVEEPYGYAHATGVASPATHTLLLWSHGFRAATDTDHSAVDHPSGSVPGYDAVTHYLMLANGYALAGSAYGSNGWAVNDGVKADVELLKTIAPANLSATPKMTYAWGESLGGLVTEMLAETHPGLITAANPQCGVLAGAVAIGDKFLDAEAAAKVFFDPALKLTGFSSDAAAAQQFEAVQTAVTNGLTGATTQASTLAKLIGIDTLLGLPLKTFAFNDQHSEASLANAAAESFLTQVGYGIQGERDVVKRTGGLPVGNITIDYRKLATTTAQNRFASYGFSKYLLSAYAQTLQTYAPRLKSNPAARAAFAGMGNPTGALKVPTLTMHTEYDQLVVVQHETVFKNRVARQGKGSLLQQLFVAPPAGSSWGLNSSTPASGEVPAYYGAGHCNFAPSQYLGAIKALDLWTATNTKPVASVVSSIVGAIDAQLGSLPGDPAAAVDPSYIEQPWPRPAQ